MLSELQFRVAITLQLKKDAYSPIELFLVVGRFPSTQYTFESLS